MVMIDIGILAHMCHMTIFEVIIQMISVFFFTIMLTIKVDSGSENFSTVVSVYRETFLQNKFFLFDFFLENWFIRTNRSCRQKIEILAKHINFRQKYKF